MNPSLMRKPPARDRLAQRHRPLVLDQQQRRGGVVRDLLDDVPRLLVGEDGRPLGGSLGADRGTVQHALLALDPESDQRADLGPELDRFVLREVAEMRHLDLTLGVLVHRERVDHPHRVAGAQSFQLGDDLAVEIRVLESEDD
jgi:hypothetical protein